MTIIEAPVSGTVLEFLVKLGDKVSEGQEVAIVESMKMEIPILAEASGTVSRLCLERGASVSEGHPLVELS